MVGPAGHVPVLLRELLEGLHVVPGGVYADCTVGAGGHAKAVLHASSPGGRLLAIDADPKALMAAGEAIQRFEDSCTLVDGNFSGVGDIARARGFYPVNGIYFDLGLSSMQLAEPGRGFSFQREDPLDMRYDITQERTAADLVNRASAQELAEVLRAYGDEPRARGVARRIVAHRPVTTTTQLARLVLQAKPGPRQRIHPATKVFQALRLWTNDEMAALEEGLNSALDLLAPGGRVAVISFHSLEDRIVKSLFRSDPRVRLVNKKVIPPSIEERRRNPRSRSAKLRIAERL